MSVSGGAPPGNAALVAASGPAPAGARVDELGPIGDPADDGAPPPAPAGTVLDFADRADCEAFNLWRPGAIPEVATIMCDPANATPTPAGETASYLDQAVANSTLIPQTGDIPVLLADADNDGVMPGEANALELAAWREHCNCDVSQFVLTDTGHAFMAHRSLTEWIDNVVAWLIDRGVGPTT